MLGAYSGDRYFGLAGKPPEGLCRLGFTERGTLAL